MSKKHYMIVGVILRKRVSLRLASKDLTVRIGSGISPAAVGGMSSIIVHLGEGLRVIIAVHPSR